MDAAHYLVLARCWWWLIAVGTVIAVAAYGLATTVRDADPAPPVYQASATLLVELPEPRAAADAPLAPRTGDEIDRLVATYAAMIGGRTVAERAAGVLGIANDPGEISRRVTTDAIGGTQLLQITVSAGTPEDAELLAGAVLRAFTEVHREQSLPGELSIFENTPAAARARDSRPEMLTVALVAIAGALAAAGIVFAFEYLSDSVRDAGDAERAAGVPVLASIPAWNAKAGLAATASPDSAERYRMLRTALRLRRHARHAGTVVFAGARTGAGATTTAVNYAVALAQGGQRVLLVDADLRAPSAQRAFGIGGYTGLADLLMSERVMTDSFLRPTGVEGLTFLPAGEAPQFPSELLDLPRFDGLLAELRTRFDAIVMDAPPVLDATDAVVLASKSDAAVLVVRCDVTARSDAAAAVLALRRSGVDVAGAVLNADPSASPPSSLRIRDWGIRRASPQAPQVRTP